LDRAWAKLQRARRIGIKFNQEWPTDRLRFHESQFQELVSDRVARAVLRLLREKTTADLVCASISTFKPEPTPEPGASNQLGYLLKEFDVEFVEGNRPPHAVYPVPGGGRMFRQYTLASGSVDVDAFVSVAKMKNHAFMGVTGCLKNLFGLTPMEPHGRARQYFHHIIRMPYMLADLGRIYDPALNVIDGLVGQAEREWGGQPRIGDCLLAGDQVIATDACMAHLMGHDPTADWPVAPFHRDRSALAVAVEAGFGAIDLSGIDFQSEVDSPVDRFYAAEIDPGETIVSWRRTTCEEALYYRDHMDEFLPYAGEYVLIHKGKVIWHNANSQFSASRRDLAQDDVKSAMFMKLVDPDEREGEHYEVYERTLARLDAIGL
jgi:uncharacterized protein (DUF362 family)